MRQLLWATLSWRYPTHLPSQQTSRQTRCADFDSVLSTWRYVERDLPLRFCISTSRTFILYSTRNDTAVVSSRYSYDAIFAYKRLQCNRNPSYGSAIQAASCTQATFASAGHVIMSSRSSHRHFARAALSFVHFFKLQSAYTNWRIDGKKFLEAFEHENEDGEWISEDDWTLGPCSGRDGARKDAFKRWADIAHRNESFIPNIARKGGRAAVNALLSDGCSTSISPDTSQKEMQSKRAKCKYCGSINWITKAQGEILALPPGLCITTTI